MSVRSENRYRANSLVAARNRNQEIADREVLRRLPRSTTYRIEALTAVRARGRVYRNTKILMDGISLPSVAFAWKDRYARQVPNALVTIVAYAACERDS
jgi:hypothetical protein